MFDHGSITPLDPYFLFGVRWYAVLILTGVFIALFWSTKEGTKKGFEKDLFMDMLIIGLPLSVLGSRLYFVLFNLGQFVQQPGRIFNFWEGGLAFHGAVITAFLYARWYLKRKNIPILPVLDIASVGFMVAQIIGRFGNFMNQEAYGRIIAGANLDYQRAFLTNLFIPEFIVNGMFINGNYHHPTFLYEAVWNLVGVLIIVFVLRKMKGILVGEIVAFYAIWYSVIRLLLEGLRTDSLMIGPFQTASVISVVIIVAAVGLVPWRRLRGVNIVSYHDFDLQLVQNPGKAERKQAYLDRVSAPQSTTLRGPRAKKKKEKGKNR